MTNLSPHAAEVAALVERDRAERTRRRMTGGGRPGHAVRVDGFADPFASLSDASIALGCTVTAFTKAIREKRDMVKGRRFEVVGKRDVA